MHTQQMLFNVKDLLNGVTTHLWADSFEDLVTNVTVHLTNYEVSWQHDRPATALTQPQVKYFRVSIGGVYNSGYMDIVHQ